jgi:hypothetical protein
MTNLLLSVILTGFAVTYLLELIEIALQWFFLSKSTINKLFSMPLSLACLYVIHRQWTLMMLVLVPAATFVALAINLYINKPAVVTRQLPRL